MPITIKDSIERYMDVLHDIYGDHLKRVILYGSYARGDYHDDSDVDIMILLDLPEMEIKQYQDRLSDCTYDFNMEYDMDMKPIAKSQELFWYWHQAYPFYKNICKEGVVLYGAA